MRCVDGLGGSGMREWVKEGGKRRGGERRAGGEGSIGGD